MVEVFATGRSGDPREFSVVPQTWIGLSSDRVLIADGQDKSVSFFDHSGQFLGTLGQEGQGPAEFQSISAVASLENGDFVVLDMVGGRLNWFTREGNLKTAQPVPVLQGAITGLSALEDRVAYVQRPLPFAIPGSPLDTFSPRVLVRTATERVREIARFPELAVTPVRLGGELPAARLFDTAPVLATLGPHLILGHSHRYSLRILTQKGLEVGRIERDVDVRAVDGDLQRLIRSALLGEAVDDPLVNQLGLNDPSAWKAVSPEDRKRAVERLEFGETLPVVGRVIRGPGETVLVQRGLGLIDQHTRRLGLGYETGELWDVFEIMPTRYLGLLAMPSGFRPSVGLDGLVGGLQTDSLDIPVVRILRVIRG